MKKSTVIPLVLGVYLALMASIGWPDYAAGRTSATFYFGVIIITLAILVLLHFNLKRRERLRRERLDDLAKSDNNKTKQA